MTNIMAPASFRGKRACGAALPGVGLLKPRLFPTVAMWIVKRGVKLDHWGGAMLDQMSVRKLEFRSDTGVWSGVLPSGLRTVVRTTRKARHSAREAVVILQSGYRLRLCGRCVSR